MNRMTREQAESILSSSGWLSHLPESLRAMVLQSSRLLRLQAGDVVYRYGDPLGGIYGLVAGTVTVNTAPAQSTPRLIHLALPGAWTGEGCFLTGQPRRVELHALTDAWAMHLPLEAMENMALHAPECIRAFAMISVLTTDLLVRVIHDLQKREGDRRIASVLHRMAWADDVPITISQDSLGEMANASRKQTNAALQKFVAAGWITTGYRSICVTDAASLHQYAQMPGAD